MDLSQAVAMSSPMGASNQQLHMLNGCFGRLEESVPSRKIPHTAASLGLFGVNMPLIYVEGAEKAFERLQQEILKVPEEGTRLFLSRAQRFDRRRPRSSKL